MGVKPRCLVFIDLDGVLNHGLPPWDPSCVAQLNRITDTTGAQIVIHSSRRFATSETDLIALLKDIGVTGAVLGVVPTPWTLGAGGIYLFDPGAYQEQIGQMDPGACDRTLMIDLWISMHQFTGPFVILDDIALVGRYQTHPRFIRTDQETGLTPQDADRAIAFLKDTP